MTLYTLKREYEERRQALVDKLQNTQDMDPAVQHQIYGAIKEIENFLQSIEFQVSSDQQHRLELELSRDRPRPFVERTRKVVKKVRSGTKKVVKERIPQATRKFTRVPKKYMERRREMRRLRKQVEAELRERMLQDGHLREEIPPPLPEHDTRGSGLSGTVAQVNVDPGSHEQIDVEVTHETGFHEDEPQQVPEPAEVPKRPAVKPARKKRARSTSSKQGTKAAKKTAKKKTGTVRKSPRKKAPVKRKASRKTRTVPKKSSKKPAKTAARKSGSKKSSGK